MPTYDYICEVCGSGGRAWRPNGHPPRFCSHKCKNRGMAGTGRKTRWPISAEMHEQIRRLYRGDTGGGQIADYAAKIGYPRWKITRHAINQGWIAKQKKEPDWCAAEIAILERNAHLSMERIQLKLKAKGYRRSVAGIVLKRKRLRLPANLRGQSARQVAECFGVDVHYVTRAIRHGRLPAKKRGTARTPQQGGDSWYILNHHLRQFIIENVHEIDLRKVDKYWFVDLVAGAGINN